MELDRKEKLLEKYFEASTTVAEENELRDYFAKEEVAPHLKQYAPMFTYFSEAKDERFTKQVPLKPRVNFYKWISVAAVAVMAFGIYFGNDYREQREAEYAYNQTRMALGLLAENFDRGTEKVAYLKEFENTKQKIYKNN
ncbi:hypothetical protein [Eudoraea chungangensis]|uniref:hypothetical protein n=1 Tax=Eudoraea chungangensis TaxID=1481905 RepID=UPI0023EB133B|nr:hypothetical protein [Eudoraea chungangensis]